MAMNLSENTKKADSAEGESLAEEHREEILSGREDKVTAEVDRRRIRQLDARVDLLDDHGTAERARCERRRELGTDRTAIVLTGDVHQVFVEAVEISLHGRPRCECAIDPDWRSGRLRLATDARQHMGEIPRTPEVLRTHNILALPEQ